MICQMCDKNFISTKWMAENIEIIVCDNCVLEILKSRREIMASELSRLDKRIIQLQNSIKEKNA